MKQRDFLEYDRLPKSSFDAKGVAVALAFLIGIALMSGGQKSKQIDANPARKANAAEYRYDGGQPLEHGAPSKVRNQ